MPGRMTRIGFGAQLAHDVDLARRRVRPQQHAGRRRVERVPHVAGRVVRRHVEQFEVRLVVLDLAAAVDLEAQVGEDGVDLAHDLGGDVQPARRHRPAGQRHVERVRRRGWRAAAVSLSAAPPARTAASRAALTRLTSWPKRLLLGRRDAPSASAERGLHLALVAEVLAVPARKAASSAHAASSSRARSPVPSSPPSRPPRTSRLPAAAISTSVRSTNVSFEEPIGRYGFAPCGSQQHGPAEC